VASSSSLCAVNVTGLQWGVIESLVVVLCCGAMISDDADGDNIGMLSPLTKQHVWRGLLMCCLSLWSINSMTWHGHIVLSTLLALGWSVMWCFQVIHVVVVVVDERG
jgi:hypothetical protein